MSSWDLTSPRDEIVEDLHAFRAQHAAEWDYNLQRLFEELKKEEARNPMRRAALKPLRPAGPKRGILQG
jgi:hypothetical protein